MAADAAPDAADRIPFVDMTGPTTEYVTVANLATVIGTALSVSALAPDFAPATTQSGTTYTVDADDHGTIVICSNAALVTVTLPTTMGGNPVTPGYNVMLFAAGAGGVTLDTTGLTLTGSAPNETIAQNEAIYCEKTSATDTWVIIGGTAA